MVNNGPKLSIGMPVYNGENYLTQALDSLLNQTYSYFRLIISDNASTDKTQEICQTYALKDKRISYFRNIENIGAAPNFYRVLELSSSEYFKWAAHDDLHAPEFLERCIHVLDNDSSIVLCCSKTKFIDENCLFIKDFDLVLDITSPKQNERFYNLLNVDHWAFPMFGVIRTNILKSTRRYGNYYGWDRNMLAEICLNGKIFQLPDYLFLRREHPHTSTSLFLSNRKLFNSYLGKDKNRYLGIKRFKEYFIAVNRAPLSASERVKCHMQLIRLAVEKSIKRVGKK